MLKLKQLSGDFAPEPACWGGATAPVPKPNSLSTLALSVSHASLGAGFNRPPNVAPVGVTD